MRAWKRGKEKRDSHLDCPLFPPPISFATPCTLPPDELVSQAERAAGYMFSVCGKGKRGLPVGFGGGFDQLGQHVAELRGKLSRDGVGRCRDLAGGEVAQERDDRTQRVLGFVERLDGALGACRKGRAVEPGLKASDRQVGNGLDELFRQRCSTLAAATREALEFFHGLITFGFPLGRLGGVAPCAGDPGEITVDYVDFLEPELFEDVSRQVGVLFCFVQFAGEQV